MSDIGKFCKVTRYIRAKKSVIQESYIGVLRTSPYGDKYVVLAEAYSCADGKPWKPVGTVSFVNTDDLVFMQNHEDEVSYRLLRAKDQSSGTYYVSNSAYLEQQQPIKYKPNMLRASPPIRASAGAAGWDVFAAVDAELHPMVATKIRTGFDIEIPKGQFLMLVPRSGYSTDNQILFPNSVGIIDEDYRGEMKIAVMWIPSFRRLAMMTSSVETLKIAAGDRICQAILMNYSHQDWRQVDELSSTERGNKGFGSTGVK